MFEKRNFYDRYGVRQFSAQTDRTGKTVYKNYIGTLMGYSKPDGLGNRVYYDRLGHRIGYTKK